MSEFTIELDWYCCPQGYRVVHAAEIARAEGRDPATYPDDEWIMPKTDVRVWYRPIDRYPSLWNVYAKVRTSADFVRFTKLYGPLIRSNTSWGDSIRASLEGASLFRDLSRAAANGPKTIASVYSSYLWQGTLAAHQAAIGRERDDLVRRGVPANEALKEAREFCGGPPIQSDSTDLFSLIGVVDMAPDPKKGVRLRVRTDTLSGALKWQLALELIKTRGGDVKLRECAHCSKWFETGVGTGRRLDSRFCSKQHQIDFNSRKRSGKLTKGAL
jgi:hypothetical protein